jgi:hypothetical protein
MSSRGSRELLVVGLDGVRAFDYPERFVFGVVRVKRRAGSCNVMTLDKRVRATRVDRACANPDRVAVGDGIRHATFSALEKRERIRLRHDKDARGYGCREQQRGDSRCPETETARRPLVESVSLARCYSKLSGAATTNWFAQCLVPPMTDTAQTHRCVARRLRRLLPRQGGFEGGTPAGTCAEGVGNSSATRTQMLLRGGKRSIARSRRRTRSSTGRAAATSHESGRSDGENDT